MQVQQEDGAPFAIHWIWPSVNLFARYGEKLCVSCTKWKSSFPILAPAICSSKGVNNLYNTRAIAEWTPQKCYIKADSSQLLLFSSPNISMYSFTLILYLFLSSLLNICKSHFQNPIYNSLKILRTRNSISLIVWIRLRVLARLVSNGYWLCKEVLYVAVGHTVPTEVKEL